MGDQVTNPNPVTLTAETASEYDFIVALDASGSMASPSKRRPGKTRWEEAQETIFGLATVLNQWDSDGIDVVIFGGGVEMHEGVGPDDVTKVFTSRSPRGSTPLAQALAEVVKKHNTSHKNTVAIVFTDGEPDDQAAAEKVIVDAANSLTKDEELTFLFVQIGDDRGATAYLEYLDDGLTGKAKFDIVDTVSASVADTMEPIDLINHAIND